MQDYTSRVLDNIINLALEISKDKKTRLHDSTISKYLQGSIDAFDLIADHAQYLKTIYR